MAMANKGITLREASFEDNPLAGCIDFHVHAGPDNVRRSVNDIELARKAREAGMRAVVVYNHQFITHDRAYLVRQVVPGIEIFGGIALNYPVGGVNPAAVDMALKFTGGCMKFVKLPTQSAAHNLASKARRAGKNEDQGGLWIIDGSGNVLPEMRKILRMIAQADIAMLTGHISPKEDLAAVKAAGEEGVRKMVINHAMNETQNVPMDIMKQLVEMGAFIEHCFLNYLQKQVTIESYVEAIRELGAEHTILSSDLGQRMNPVPTEGLREFILLLMKQGITREEIELMTKHNPAQVLGLEPCNGRAGD
jgi:hypothetical protein